MPLPRRTHFVGTFCNFSWNLVEIRYFWIFKTFFTSFSICLYILMQEVQVERLMEKAVAQSERPWLILLTTLSSISAILLTLILLRLQQGGHL